MLKDHAPWFNAEILRAKKERLWRRFGTDEARGAYQEAAYREARNIKNRLVTKRKSDYYRSKIVEVGSNINKLHGVLDSLTGHRQDNKLPDGFPDAVLASMFLDYFDKVENVIMNLRPDSFQRPAQDMPVPVAILLSFQ